MNLVRVHDYADLSARAAASLVDEVAQKPDLAFIAATGESPRLAYSQVPGLAKDRGVGLGRAVVVQLDEWVGLSPTAEGSCAAFLKTWVIDPWAIAPGNWWAWDGTTADPQRDCVAFSDDLALRGGADLCVLGLGANGHLALNEPAEALNPRAHVAELAPSSRTHSMVAGLAKAPSQGLTLGLGEILQSRRILLLVSGASKRAVFQEFLKGRVDPRLPASFLWLHGDVTCLVTDEVAG